MPIHLAITRRIRNGCEAEFEQAVREFLASSLAQQGVLAVHLLSPPPGSESREYGILRSFASEGDRAAFYQSSAFQAWERKVRPMTDGFPRLRELHGLEAWFRGAEVPPPRWKMATLTFLGVYTTTLPLTFAFGPHLRLWPLPVGNAAFNLMVVPLLTWAVMPTITRVFNGWLRAA
jgi:antibiotic biosynthesis monooxygenase (ABM) superfamily enzyme